MEDAEKMNELPCDRRHVTGAISIRTKPTKMLLYGWLELYSHNGLGINSG